MARCGKPCLLIEEKVSIQKINKSLYLLWLGRFQSTAWSSWTTVGKPLESWQLCHLDVQVSSYGKLTRHMGKSPPIHQLPTQNIQKLPMWVITGACYGTIQTIQEWMLPASHAPRFLQKWYKHRRKEYANHWSTTSAKCFDFQGSKWLRHRAVACYVHVLPDWTSGLHFSQEATGLCKSPASRLVKL